MSQPIEPFTRAEVAALLAACDVIIEDAEGRRDPETMARLPVLQAARQKLKRAYDGRRGP